MERVRERERERKGERDQFSIHNDGDCTKQ